MDVFERIEASTKIPGVSGREAFVAEWIMQQLQEMGAEAFIDERGNVHGLIASKNPHAKTVLLEAHMDSIGLMISAIEKGGFLSFEPVGGVDERILHGLEVEIQTNPPLWGVVQCKEPQKEKKTVADFRIDTGLDTKEIKKRVKVGDVALIRRDYQELCGDKITAAALDNRAGVGALLYCAAYAKTHDCPYHVALLFATAEELGMQGARVSCPKADLAIVVDVTYGMCPQSKDMTGVFSLGSGVAIGRGPSLDDKYVKEVIALAKEQQIPYTIEPLSGNSGTDAWAIQVSHGGIPCVLLSIPLRYMHTPIEVIEKDDVLALCQLIQSCLSGGVSLA